MNRTEILRKIYQVYYVRGLYNVFSCLLAKQSRAHEHSSASAAATLSSTRTTLCSSSTRTPVVAVLVLLRTARAALEGTSMSRFPSLYYCTAKNGHGTTITRLLKRNEHERQTRTRRGQAVTGTRALSSSGSSTQRHSSNTRVEKHSYACCCCCFTAANCSSMSSTKSQATQYVVQRCDIKY